MNEEEILEMRRTFCNCWNSVIDAYKEQLDEVRRLRNKLQLCEEESRGKSKIIEKLQRRVNELNEQFAKVCDGCKEKITENMSSTSIQESVSDHAVIMKIFINMHAAHKIWLMVLHACCIDTNLPLFSRSLSTAEMKLIKGKQCIQWKQTEEINQGRSKKMT